jgi:PAS domain S-box-containing protein
MGETASWWRASGAVALGGGLVLLLSAAFAAMVYYRLPDPGTSVAIDDVGEAVAALIAAIACAWATTQTQGRIRAGWTLMAISAVAWAAGEIVWSVYEVGLGEPVPYPGWPDVGFLAAMPFAFAGILAFWSPPRGTASRWRVWLDGAIVVLALLFTAWVLGLRLVVQDNDDTGLTRTLDIAYPLGDILIGTVLILAVRRATRRRAARVFVLLLGVAAIAVADSAFAYLSATGTLGEYGSVLDTGWVAGYLLIALAAAWPRSPVTRTAESVPVDLWQLALPWLAVLAIGISSLGMVLAGQSLDLVLTLIVGVAVVLLAVSMILTSRDFLGMLITSKGSQATLAEIIERAPAGVVRMSNDLWIIEANPRFRALVQSHASEAGQRITRFFSDSEARRFETRIAALRSGADAVEDDIEAQRADGSRLWVHWSATAVRDAEGHSDYFIAMFEDTTERHEADAARAASLELLQRLNKLKTEFLQSVSHEFKTALIGIQGFSEFMRDSDQLDVNDVRGFAADIHRDAERLDRMVTEMIALDHVESARAGLRVSPVDLNALIGREVAAARPAAGALFVLDLQPGLPRVSGDEEKLGEVMRTLLRNAIRYSPDGGRVTVTSRSTSDTVTVGVLDEGVAARADFDNRLFGQEDIYSNNPIRKVVGTGLGLGIVRQIVEMHGGKVWVDGIEGKGSAFHFTLPVAPVSAPVEATL